MADIDFSQSVLHCQFCNQSTGIKWKCINCDLLLCSLCSYNIHSKQKSSKNHKIINIQECGTEEEAQLHRTVNLVNLTCGIHDGHRAVTYSKDCAAVICFKCSKGPHNNHNVEDILIAYETTARIKRPKRQH